VLLLRRVSADHHAAHEQREYGKYMRVKPCCWLEYANTWITGCRTLGQDPTQSRCCVGHLHRRLNYSRHHDVSQSGAAGTRPMQTEAFSIRLDHGQAIR
jgi:hypothetical protein